MYWFHENTKNIHIKICFIAHGFPSFTSSKIVTHLHEAGSEKRHRKTLKFLKTLLKSLPNIKRKSVIRNPLFMPQISETTDHSSFTKLQNLKLSMANVSTTDKLKTTSSS